MNFVKHLNLFGLEAKEIPCLTGTGKPTASTEGAAGCLYMDTSTGTMYKCATASNGVPTWVVFENPLTGSIADITPRDVRTAIVASRPVLITANFTCGTMQLTAFSIHADTRSVTASAIFLTTNNSWVLCTIFGDYMTNEWSLNEFALK